MKPLGLSDLPDNPMLMPGPQLSQKIGLNPGADAPNLLSRHHPEPCQSMSEKSRLQMQSARSALAGSRHTTTPTGTALMLMSKRIRKNYLLGWDKSSRSKPLAVRL